MAKEIHTTAANADENANALRLEVDLDKFELEDWEILDGSKPGTRMTDLLDCLDRLLVGGARGRGFKGTQLAEIQQAILAEFQQAINPSKNGKN